MIKNFNVKRGDQFSFTMIFGQNHWVGSTIANSSFAFIAGGKLTARSYNTHNASSLPYEIVLEYIK